MVTFLMHFPHLHELRRPQCKPGMNIARFINLLSHQTVLKRLTLLQQRNYYAKRKGNVKEIGSNSRLKLD